MKLVYPAAERNKDAILEVLREALPKTGLVLEIASGSGEHSQWFAKQLPDLVWQPSDMDPQALLSIHAYRADAGLPNLKAPVVLDAAREPWPITEAAAIVCVNMIHIAPWSACLGLFRGGARVLAPGAPLILYGPFAIDGDYIAESNRRFDESLRARDSSWGVRELRDVQRAAEQAGFELESVVPRPANNHVIVFRRTHVPPT